MDKRGRFIGLLIVVTVSLALALFGHLFLFD
jgi:hypothetical protein